MAPNLMNIPPEIQGLLGCHLHITDLKSVSGTCKTLHTAFLAKLYTRVVIRVPIRWSRLVSLEHLISSTGSGFKFTTDICITAQQQPLKDGTEESEDGLTTQEIADERKLLFCLPQISASKALNVLIRLLLIRIPDNGLKLFDWRHSCALETSTLALLLKHQGATLRRLDVTRYAEPQDISSLSVQGLQHLAINDLNIKQRCEWPGRLIAQNRNSLRHLYLGVISTVTRHYAHHHGSSQYRLPASLAEMAKDTLPANEQQMMRTLSLETLGLYGLNFKNVVGGALGLQIDFDSMTTLRLESCSGLHEAFAVLMGNDDSQNATLSGLKLKSFFVRHEDGGQAFAQQLTAFLTSFTGLQHMGLLLEGQRRAMSKAPILEMHGKTLQTLVWDERKRSREATSQNTSSFFLKDNDLRIISLKCPNLTALGLSIRWGVVPPWSAARSPFGKMFRRMPKLRTLHLRNMPKTEIAASFLPNDYMVKSLASAILDMYAGGKRSNRQMSLTTIALGAPVYGDIHIGSNHFPNDPVRDFFQLRVYYVDYKYQSVLGPSPTVTQVAKGTADDATTCLDKDVLHEYWLA